MTAAVSPESPDTGAILATWTRNRDAKPPRRARDLASDLGVSECELVAARCGHDVVRLDADWMDLLARLEPLGPLMALTRNESAVIEKTGVYAPVSFAGAHGLVLGEDIDLRLFMGRWKYGFAVPYETPRGVRHGLQFFAAHGTAIHKIYLAPDSDEAAYHRLVEASAADDQSPRQAVEPAPAPKAETPDAEIDVTGFQAAWLALQDTHDFFPMLRTFGVSRTQALRLAPDGMARPIAADVLQPLLERAAADALPIMVFVGNHGCIEIHTGPVERVVARGGWVNVLDAGFNLHVRGGDVAAAWVVRKPTEDGEVTSVELFDAEGTNVALLFGKRKPGIPEDERWRALARSL